MPIISAISKHFSKRSKFLLHLLIYGLSSVTALGLQAQNWKSIPFQDTQYYKAISSGTIDENTNYLKCIWIDSVSMIGNDSIYYFNVTLTESDSNNNCLVHGGASWLGRKFSRDNNGDEYFFNLQNESILIKTTANIADTWTFFIDSNNYNYQATISSLDTMTIDGSLDSIKEISIHVDSLGFPVSHFYSNKKILLSKQHGLIVTVAFLYFPYVTYFHDFIQTSPFNHHAAWSYRRVDSNIKRLNFAKIDFVDRYKPGNEWIIQYGEGYGPYMNWQNGIGHGVITTIHDSVISSSPISADQIIVVLNRINNKKTKSYTAPIPPNPYPVLHFSDTTFTEIKTDTITQSQDSIFLNPQWIRETKNIDTFTPTSIPKSYLHYYGPYPVLSADYHMQPLTYQNNCTQIFFSVSGYSIYRESYVGQFGFKEDAYAHYSFSTALTNNGFDSLLYFNINGNIYGNKIHLAPHAIENNFQNYGARVYPNPCTDQLHITLENNSPIQALSIINMQGNKIYHSTDRNPIVNIQTLPIGHYLLVIQSNGQVYSQKFVKE
jgi:hypothetical protein